MPAARALLRAVAVRPQGAPAHYYLGLAYLRMGLWRGGVQQLQEAIRIAPDDARFYDGLGEAYRESHDPAMAQRNFEEAIQRNPREIRYRIDLAGALLDEGRMQEAIKELRNVAALQAGSPEVHLLLTETLRRGGDRPGMEEEYRQVIRSALGQDPPSRSVIAVHGSAKGSAPARRGGGDG